MSHMKYEAEKCKKNLLMEMMISGYKWEYRTKVNTREQKSVVYVDRHGNESEEWNEFSWIFGWDGHQYTHTKRVKDVRTTCARSL